LRVKFFGKPDHWITGEFAVKRKRFSVEQIVAVRKRAELGIAHDRHRSGLVGVAIALGG